MVLDGYGSLCFFSVLDHSMEVIAWIGRVAGLAVKLERFTDSFGIEFVSISFSLSFCDVPTLAERFCCILVD